MPRERRATGPSSPLSRVRDKSGPFTVTSKAARVAPCPGLSKDKFKLEFTNRTPPGGRLGTWRAEHRRLLAHAHAHEGEEHI